jgi:hypothetical protein
MPTELRGVAEVPLDRLHPASPVPLAVLILTPRGGVQSNRVRVTMSALGGTKMERVSEVLQLPVVIE